MPEKSTKNEDRYLVKMLREISQKHQIQMDTLSYNWIIKLTKGKLSQHIFGYNFEINSSTAQLIAGDKSACSNLLKLNNIPTATHQLFLNPKLEKYVDLKGNWENLIHYFENNNQKIICKAASGTGGNQVYKVNSRIALEKVVHHLFNTERSITLSPFYEIAQEYRVLILDQEIELIYQKEIPSIVGDGQQNLINLITQHFPSAQSSNILGKIDLPLSYLPQKGEKVNLNWKHNLGKGAKALLLRNSHPKYKALSTLAKEAATTIHIRFASVDIIETANEELKVLEINSGIMIENIAHALPEKYEQLKGIYEKAILKHWGLE